MTSKYIVGESGPELLTMRGGRGSVLPLPPGYASALLRAGVPGRQAGGAVGDWGNPYRDWAARQAQGDIYREWGRAPGFTPVEPAPEAAPRPPGAGTMNPGNDAFLRARIDAANARVAAARGTAPPTGPDPYTQRVIEAAKERAANARAQMMPSPGAAQPGPAPGQTPGAGGPSYRGGPGPSAAGPAPGPAPGAAGGPAPGPSYRGGFGANYTAGGGWGPQGAGPAPGYTAGAGFGPEPAPGPAAGAPPAAATPAPQGPGVMARFGQGVANVGRGVGTAIARAPGAVARSALAHPYATLMALSPREMDEALPRPGEVARGLQPPASGQAAPFQYTPQRGWSPDVQITSPSVLNGIDYWANLLGLSDYLPAFGRASGDQLATPDAALYADRRVQRDMRGQAKDPNSDLYGLDMGAGYRMPALPAPGGAATPMPEPQVVAGAPAQQAPTMRPMQTIRGVTPGYGFMPSQIAQMTPDEMRTGLMSLPQYQEAMATSMVPRSDEGSLVAQYLATLPPAERAAALEYLAFKPKVDARVVKTTNPETGLEENLVIPFNETRLPSERAAMAARQPGQNATQPREQKGLPRPPTPGAGEVEAPAAGGETGEAAAANAREIDDFLRSLGYKSREEFMRMVADKDPRARGLSRRQEESYLTRLYRESVQ